jgi:hypothetical protein
LSDFQVKIEEKLQILEINLRAEISALEAKIHALYIKSAHMGSTKEKVQTSAPRE